MYKTSKIIASALCVVLLAAPPAYSRSYSHEQARNALEAGEIASLRDVVTTCEADFSGRIVQADLSRDFRGWVYNLKMLTPNGSILKMRYDALTKELVSARGHDLVRWYRGEPAALAEVASPGSIRSRVREEPPTHPTTMGHIAHAAPWYHKLLQWLEPDIDGPPPPSSLEPDLPLPPEDRTKR